ncbi:DUF308 domain-containing protein [Nocardia sp. CA2R105]|uniref:DUF308 domain-containing protein n=1 Tax=Nocardia coffeae TaxID=2873381 RepID=UPI001CA77836|nr:DUF308 domain-containing protein [Nocardia coffeae]MBY8863271.1 DUF308 domain-containing protein [Nocardia coffeae]
MPTFRVAGRTDVYIGEAWQAALAIGCTSVVLGVVMMVWPGNSIWMSELLFGIAMLLTAAWQMVLAFRGRIRTGLKILEFGTALVAVLLAMWCMRSGDWVSLVALWVGLGWVIRGIVQATVAVWSDQLPGTGRQEIAGLLTLLAGLAVIIWPIDTLDALAVLAGVCLILLGISEIRIATRIARPESTPEHVGVQGLLRSHS